MFANAGHRMPRTPDVTTAGRDAVLSLSGVTKRFGRTTAVESVDLDVWRGDLLCLLGPNGAGKTTLLRMIVGLSRPSEGTILLMGRDPAEEPEVRRRLGYLSDKPFLYDKLTSEEHLRLHAALYGLSGEKVLREGADLLDRLGLRRDPGQRVESYSFGMQKKLALALALVHQPDLLVLDEPLNGLDPGSTGRVEGLLRRHVAQAKAVVMSTHSPHFAATFANRVGIMRAGRLARWGVRRETGAP
jgi:ABC-2 type transport system ATP-binding protein